MIKVAYIAIEGAPDLYLDTNELEHYGRLGMKWYQHKYGEVDGRSKYAKKGMQKLAKISAKEIKAKEKVQKAEYKADKAEMRYWENPKKRRLKKMIKSRKKLAKAKKKLYKNSHKGERFAKKMTTLMGPISKKDLTSEEVRTAQRYCMDLVEDRNKS